jgi:hypothetical protein
MRTLLAVLAALVILAPAAALAGSSKSKVTVCSTSTSYFGAKTVCRTK